MNKLEQYRMNHICNMIYDEVMVDLMVKNYPFKRWYGDLMVCETENWHVLQYRNDIVAAISKNSNVLYDFLRRFYPYSKSVNIYISKFGKTFSEKYSYDEKCTWRVLK